MKYESTIGLEIHAELKTRTKMFCDSLNNPDEKEPNVNVCPICLAHPGTLPVMNKKAVEAVIKVGMALHGDIPAKSKFDRKNYFYPDLPKGYQISQYDVPLVFGGVLNGVQLTRIHLEEDTGRLLHAEDKKYSLVDFNRAGVPLMELVTEPDMKTAEEAVAFARELQMILRYLGVSDADMEKGQMRVEANVSLGTMVDGKKVLGTKVEVKNINSFKAVAGAIEYEFRRQKSLLDDGENIAQETRGWDEHKQATVSQRSKEEAHDYRYFPEPDLPPLDISVFDLHTIQKSIPELPQAKRVRFIKEYGLSPDVVDVLVSDREHATFFENSASELSSHDKENFSKEVVLLGSYLNADVRGILIEQRITFSEMKLTPENFSDLIELISHDKVSSRTAKDLLREMVIQGGDPNTLLTDKGLEQVSDEVALGETVSHIIEANPDAVADFKKGKENAVQFLVGKAMGVLKGAGNPQVLRKLFEEELKKS